MKSLKKRIFLTAMMIVFTLMAASGTSAKTIKQTVGAPINLNKQFFIYDGPASGITDVKSSNKKVAEVSFENNETYVSAYLVLKKTGITNISYKITNNGQTDTYKIKLCVYKYKNPFKVLKVGKFNYKSQFNRGYYSTLQKGQGKVQVKVKNGWKLKGIYAQNAAGTKKLKKNAQVDIEHYKDSVKIELQNTKYGFLMNFWIFGYAG